MSAEDLKALALLSKGIAKIGEADTGKFPIFFVGALPYKVTGAIRRGELVELSLFYDEHHEEYSTDVLVVPNVVTILLAQLTLEEVVVE